MFLVRVTMLSDQGITLVITFENGTTKAIRTDSTNIQTFNGGYTIFDPTVRNNTVLPVTAVDPLLPSFLWRFITKVDIDVRPGPPREPEPGPPKPGPCDPNYSGACVPVFPPDVDCNGYENVRVVGDDVHRLDRDNDGIGCEKDIAGTRKHYNIKF